MVYMKKLINTITYSNKSTRKNGYKKFGANRKTKEKARNESLKEANATKVKDTKDLYS